MTRYDVIGVLASGTIVRGTPDPRSDLDIQVLHRGDFRQRVQVFSNGIPCEIFVNPPARSSAYLVEERRDRRALTAHMFATGFVICDTDGVVAGLVDAAKRELADSPAVDPASLQRNRYMAATTFEDAEDLCGRDPESGALLLGVAVYRLAECRVEAEPGWLPRAKDLLARLRQVDPACADLVVSAGEGSLVNRLESARELCRLCTGADGFYEWASEAEACG